MVAVLLFRPVWPKAGGGINPNVLRLTLRAGTG